MTLDSGIEKRRNQTIYRYIYNRDKNPKQLSHKTIFLKGQILLCDKEVKQSFLKDYSCDICLA